MLALVPASQLAAQEPPAPITAVAPATLNRLFSEAEAAFAAKDFDTAVAKIQELLAAGIVEHPTAVASGSPTHSGKEP